MTQWTEEMMKNLPTIGVGASGVFVRYVQALCVANDIDLAIDGIFGTETQTAVQAIQRNANITADGIVGQATWPALLGV